MLHWETTCSAVLMKTHRRSSSFGRGRCYQYRDYMVSDGTVGKGWTGNDSEGSGSGLIEVLSQHSPEGTAIKQWKPWITVAWPRFEHSTSRILVQKFTSRQTYTILTWSCFFLCATILPCSGAISGSRSRSFLLCFINFVFRLCLVVLVFSDLQVSPTHSHDILHIRVLHF